jgi:FkbM family methyltransferase
MIIVDIGANRGDLGKFLLESQLNVEVYAVEPNYAVCETSLQELSDNYPTKFSYISAAISDSDGVTRLYAPNAMDGQIASILKINEQLAWDESVSRNFRRESLNETIDVKTITVENFVKFYNLMHIDFLKIDAQGLDLPILEAFLKSTEVVVAAVEIEVTASASLSHYSESKNSFQAFLKVLDLTGFEIIKIMPVSGDCSEYNIFIAKSLKDYEKVDEALNFRIIPIFSRFWKVLGIGDDSRLNIHIMQRSLLRKLVSGFLHPKSSYKSLLLKLTS